MFSISVPTKSSVDFQITDTILMEAVTGLEDLIKSKISEIFKVSSISLKTESHSPAYTIEGYSSLGFMYFKLAYQNDTISQSKNVLSEPGAKLDLIISPDPSFQNGCFTLGLISSDSSDLQGIISSDVRAWLNCFVKSFANPSLSEIEFRRRMNLDA